METRNKPAWEQALNYDFRVRKLAPKFIHDDGLGMAVALKKAREDKICYRRWLLTPMVVDRLYVT